MMLLMCCSNKPAPAQQAASENKASVAETMDEDTPTDVRSFGMAGKVKEVRLCVADLSADSEGDPWVEDNKLEMKLGVQTSPSDTVHKYKTNNEGRRHDVPLRLHL